MSYTTRNTPKYLSVSAAFALGALAAGSMVPAHASPADAAPATQETAPGEEGFASIADLETFTELSAEEQEKLLAALEDVPEELRESGDYEAIHQHIVETAGLDESAHGIETRALPAAILAARAVACLGPAYASLRNITSGSPDVVAASIAGAIAGCVTGGGASAIKTIILNNRALFANGLRAVGLGSLALLLEGDSANYSSASYAPQQQLGSSRVDPTAIPA